MLQRAPAFNQTLIRKQSGFNEHLNEFNVSTGALHYIDKLECREAIKFVT